MQAIGIVEKISRNRARSVKLALLLLSAVIAPAVILDFFLSDFQDSLHKAFLEEDLERARTIMARMDRELNRSFILVQTFHKVLEALQKRFERKPVSEKTVGAMSGLFRSVFPKSSQLIWLNGALEIVSDPLDSTHYGRIWQTFAKVISCRLKPTNMEMKQAKAAANRLFGDIITIDFLQQAAKAPIEILYEGKAHLMSFMAFNEPGQQTNLMPKGFLLAFIPLDCAQKDWELKRAIKMFTTETESVGGYRQSCDIAYENADLSENLMHGLSEELKKGNPEYELMGRFYLSRFQDRDPDLVLHVSVQSSSERSSLPLAGNILRSALWCIVCLMIVGAFIVSFEIFTFSINLKMKFQIGSFLVAGTPLIAMLLWGIGHISHLNRVLKDEAQKFLESRIAEVERNMVDGIAHIETLVGNACSSGELYKLNSANDLKPLYENYARKGCRSIICLKKNGQYFFQSADKSSVVDQFISAIYVLMYDDLKSRNFVKPARLQESLSLGDILEDGSLGSNELLFDRLSLVEIAQANVFMYNSFILNERRELDSLYIFYFDRALMQSYLMSGIIESIGKRGDIFLRPLYDQGKGYEPKNSRLRDLLDIVQYTGRYTRHALTHLGKNYFAFARPMKEFELIGGTVIPASDLPKANELVLGLIIVLAIAFSALIHVVYRMMTNVFLEPILCFTDEMNRIDRGILEVNTVLSPSDELGLLEENCNTMVEGLKQKADMLPFLRKDLVLQTAQNQEIQATRRNAAILFAGIRDFSLFESRLSPEEAMNVMNEFLGICEKGITDSGGELDKFIGDTAMGVFFADVPKLALENAMKAALMIDVEAPKHLPAGVKHGIGIAAGDVFAGHIGSLKKRLDHTVIGDTVNLAARLEKLAGSSDNPSILALEETVMNVLPDVVLVPTKITSVRGRTAQSKAVGLSRVSNE